MLQFFFFFFYSDFNGHFKICLKNCFVHSQLKPEQLDYKPESILE